MEAKKRTLLLATLTLALTTASFVGTTVGVPVVLDDPTCWNYGGFNWGMNQADWCNSNTSGCPNQDWVDCTADFCDDCPDEMVAACYQGATLYLNNYCY